MATLLDQMLCHPFATLAVLIVAGLLVRLGFAPGYPPSGELGAPCSSGDCSEGGDDCGVGDGGFDLGVFF